MTIDDVAQRAWAWVNAHAIQPVERFLLGIDPQDRIVACALLATAAILGFVVGRRRSARPDSRSDARWPRPSWRLPGFQNDGEARVSRLLQSRFGAPAHHLMNHVTLRLDDGTTQIDHILVSRAGIFVIETKDYRGWIFADAANPTWTQVLFRARFRFQNPIHQNYRHVCAVRTLLDFVPPDAIRSVVVFCGSAEFRTPMPEGVTKIDGLAEYIGRHTEPVMSRNRQQLCIGRLEAARLAISRRTDVEHVETLARRYGQAH